MNKKLTILMCLLVCVAMSICACTSATPTQANSTKVEEAPYQSNLNLLSPLAYGNVDGLSLEPGAVISILGKASGTPYWDAVKAGAQQAIDDINTNLGYKGDEKVKLSYAGPSNSDNADEQVNILDEELARYPSALGIAITDASACDVQFDLATENGIPIVAFDSGSNYQGIMSMISTDNEEAAKTAATKLATSMDKTGEVILVIHDSRSTTGIIRERAITEELQKNYPEIKIAKTIYLDKIEDEKEAIAKIQNETKEEGAAEITTDSIKNEDVLTYYMETMPNVHGYIGTNVDTTQLIVKACDMKKVDGDITTVVGFDGGETQIADLENGKIDGLVVQNPFGMGYATVVAASRAVLGLGNEATVDSGYVWVTVENMEKPSIQKILY